jgi:uncharacterized protein with FMN-binding domain
MKRAPIVLTSTACGVVALVSYHAAVPQASALTSSSTAATLNVSGGGTSKASSSQTASASASSSTKATAKQSASTGAGAATTRSAVGSDAQYPYGDLEVKVTMTGTKLVDVTVVKHDVTDPRSQMIDQIAVPELRSQALSLQSAKLDGVSGASYTSAAYEQSLQSALDKLKA